MPQIDGRSHRELGRHCAQVLLPKSAGQIDCTLSINMDGKTFDRSVMGKLDRVSFGGEEVDRRTADMLREAQRIANAQDPSIRRVPALSGFLVSCARPRPARTEAQAPSTWARPAYSDEQQEIIGLALRTVGFASWERLPSQGPWPGHWHGIAMGTEGLPRASLSSRCQLS